MPAPACTRPDTRANFTRPALGKRRGSELCCSAQFSMKSAEEEAFSYTPNVSLSLPLGMATPCLASQYHNLQSSPVISVSSCHQASYGLHESTMAPNYYFSGLRPNGAPPLERPRIEITSYGQMPEEQVEESGTMGPVAKRVNIVTLTLPSADGYRDPSSLSPASSCNSEASYESGFYNYENSPQNSPWQSPCVSPKGSSSLMLSCPPHGHAPGPSPRHSPSTSPNDDIGNHGKRKYSFNGTPYGHAPGMSPNHSPGASPQGSPRLEEGWLGTTNQYTNSAIVAAINALSTDGFPDLVDGVPNKSRKTSVEHNPSMSLKVEPANDDAGTEHGQEDYTNSNRMPFKKESYCSGFLDVPPHPYSWPKPKPYLSPSLPALDWQLPSCSGPYNLQIEVQPKSHHRAHYETEGSRGAVKALSGGHPVVQLYGYMESEPLTLQLFIGTADDRLLRPHAFYQVHRITGKTVSTASHEAMQSNTKVLEIPLLPENNMRAIIDCAGILKLRNSDIELRKGETDIGRKNTRVRMVFRVHINQPNGRTVSLQVASNPIECSQRSAQELPLVEKQSLDSYPASGGKRMLLSGHNFLPESKVMFVEKAQDGHHVWETEANVDKESRKSTSLVVEIPPYRNQRISSSVNVSFYVCNGKRKRSQYQRFTYLPCNVPMIKTEPADDYESRMSIHANPYFGQQRLPTMMPLDEPEPCMVASYAPCVSRPTPMPYSSPSSSPKLHDLSPVPFPKCLSNSPTHSTMPGGMASMQDPSTHHGLALPSSPDPVSLTMHHPQGSPHLGSPSYHPLYPNSSPSSSPTSHPSTPGAAAESPYLATFGSAQPRGSPPTLVADDHTSPALPVTIKQEPQELDQMYLDDVNEIIRNDLSCTSSHGHS
ncbi:nuclear factor of activated T-cells, cytoplasmic 1-like isoform X1 [Hemibagrus wyckioides]|uniref:nuclear factor of activated T-cells, cytoplasmic 1-like isoform X1 n=1 Tax=Hemibagrus wyckioides TaxID=337641 RepID=UPI00266BD275|nr:nuclear factor of activated T-cells, cytoplasmic 1-like isoform X1 [Hemibagrus wyckioides]